MGKAVIVPGSFDPPTEGHINIVDRALKIFDKVIIAVAVNTRKQPTFTSSERVEMLKEIFKNNKNVEVDKFEGLLVEYAKKREVMAVLRGIRTMSDYEYEFQMSLANKTLYPELESMFMMTEGKYSHLTSSIIKEIITFGGDGKGMIHPVVEKHLKEKLQKK